MNIKIAFLSMCFLCSSVYAYDQPNSDELRFQMGSRVFAVSKSGDSEPYPVDGGSCSFWHSGDKKDGWVEGIRGLSEVKLVTGMLGLMFFFGSFPFLCENNKDKVVYTVGFLTSSGLIVHTMRDAEKKDVLLISEAVTLGALFIAGCVRFNR